MKITLRAARVNAGLTQQEASKKIGVSQPTLGRWEREDRSPSIKQFNKICRIYGVDPEDIKLPDQDD